MSANFLDVLGIAPLHGRGFLRAEQQLGPKVAMISASLWQRRFGGDPRAVGTSVTLASGTAGAESYTIVGILPPDLTLPLPGLDVWRPWQPDALPLAIRQNSPLLAIVGRLRSGVSRAEADAELAVRNRQYAGQHPGALDARAGESILPLQEFLVRDVRAMLWMLFGAVAFLMLMACANVVSLMLARTASRAAEFAIRAALGAGRGRLISAQLAESLLLALGGGGLGLGLAWLSLGWLTRLPGLELPRADEVRLDGAVLGFTLLATLMTCLITGLGPALGAARPDLARVIKASGEANSLTAGTRLALRPRGWIVMGQIALSVVLLIGATLMVESMAGLRGVQPGFDSRNLLTMEITLPQSRQEELVRRVESIPGVRAAAVTLTLPMTGFAGTPVQAADQPMLKLNERTIAILQTVTPGYFGTLGIPLRQGRDFAASDTSSSPLVAMVNESLARRFWPGDRSPVGRSVLIGSSPLPVLVTGIVGDVQQASLAEAARPGLYRPRTQTPEMPAMLAVRTSGDPLRYVRAIRGELMAIDAHQAIAAVRTMEAVLDSSEGQRGSVTLCLALFAATGLLLVVVGLYGAMSYAVTRRMRDLSIRRALGAQDGDILRLVLGQGLGLALAGVLLGIGGALALSRLLQGWLFQVGAMDPATYLGVALVMLLVAIAASYLPARRALGGSRLAGW